MLETTPCHWNGLVCICTEGCNVTLALMQSNQREILGIVSHTLRNWHSGFSGLVVGVAGKCCVAITRVGSGSGRSGEGRAVLCWLSEEELLVQMYVFNDHTLITHILQFWDSLRARPLVVVPFSGSLCPRPPRSRSPLYYNVWVAAVTTGWLCYTT